MDLIIVGLLVVIAILLIALFVLRLVRPNTGVNSYKAKKYRRYYEEEDEGEEEEEVEKEIGNSAYSLPSITVPEEEDNGTYVFDDVVFDEPEEVSEIEAAEEEPIPEVIAEEEPEVRVDEETTVIPLVPVPKFQTAKSLVQIVNLNPRHVIEIIGKQAVVYPHIVFDMATSARIDEEVRGWKVVAGQKLAITLGIKLLGSGVVANFVPAQTDYLEFEQSVVSLTDFVANKAIITIQARVLEDAYILKDFGIGKIKLV